METLLDAALRLAAPLLLAALGELLVERAGVINIGIEGMMLCGAFAAFAASVASGQPAVGVLAGVAAGCGMGAVFVVFAVLRRADQIVVGTAVMENTYESTIYNDGNGLIAALGVSDLVIARSGDVVMVAHKTQLDKVRDLLAKMAENPDLKKHL